MGDFSINFLNYESHTPTDDYINNWGGGVFCFQPHFLQPSRITDHTATLTDNIYFNSIEHCCISGNWVWDISDHLPNFLFINKLSSSSNQIIYRRDYSKSDGKNSLRMFS